MKKLLLLPALLTVSLLAQTFNVSTTPEFRTALTNAAQNGEDDTIILADGTYKTTDDGQGTFIFLDNEAHTLSLKGSDSTNVILSGDHLNQILKHNSTAKAPLLLEKLSFFDANTTELGGAVRASDDIIVTDCNISNNITTYEGGGLFTGEKVIITDSYFSNNMAYSGGAFRSGNYTEVKKSVFVENKAGTYGGGFYQFNGTTLIENSNFINNNARDGGAMLLPYNSQGALVKNSTFISNSSNGWGAAIGFFNGSGKLSVYNSIFRNNKGTNNTVINSSDATLINSLFVENSKLYISGNSSVLNSIIISTIIDGYTTSLISVTNSYINQDEVLVDSLSSNLIYSNLNLK